MVAAGPCAAGIGFAAVAEAVEVRQTAVLDAEDRGDTAVLLFVPEQAAPSDLALRAGLRLMGSRRLAKALAAAAWNLEPSDEAWAALANAAVSAATGSFTGPHGGAVDRVAASPDGAVLATADDYGSVVLWDLETGSTRVFEERLSSSLAALEFSPDGRFLAASASDRELIVWDLLDRSAMPIASANATLSAADPSGFG